MTDLSASVAIDPFTPVHPAYCADPFVLAHNGVYYAYGTGGPDKDRTPTRPGNEHFVLLRSTNLTDWEDLGGALTRPTDPTLGTHFWAPEVAAGDDGKFYMYYSVGKDGEAGHQLRVAIADTPEGPFVDAGGPPLIPQLEVPFAIDAHPFKDADGQWYLYYARDFLDFEEGGHRSGTGLAVRKLVNMTTLDTEDHLVLRARYEWQRFEKDRRMSEYNNQVFDWHTLEGASVVPHEGRYYCFYSAAAYHSETYGVDYAVADHPLGPWFDDDNQSGPRILRTIPNKLRGPGHNSTFIGPNHQLYIAYHAWNAEHTKRQMHLAQIVWTPDGPRVSGV